MKPYVLVTGATGYVGGRLVPRLLASGYRVRAAARSLKKLQSRPWANDANLDCVYADVFNLDSLDKALNGCDAAYYLVHSMGPEHEDFSKADKEAAHIFLAAAEKHHLKQIIYLGGLGESNPSLSKHLASRAEVGNILRQGTVPVTTLRAAMIIGSGSASFEILRYLVERLPIMVTPKWVFTATQPIAIKNVIHYLIGCLECEATKGDTFDIGGPDIVNYRNLMEIYAEEVGLARRLIIPVPFFTPKLSSYWIHFVTPVGKSIARPLTEGLRNETICRENHIQKLIPQTLVSYREAIHLALERYRNHEIETHWTDAGLLPPLETIYPGDPSWSGGTVYLDCRSMLVEGNLKEVWGPIVGIGGEHGWYYGNALWQLRGIMDLFFGGVGLKRGRRDPDKVNTGDALDFWRVVDVVEDKRLFLRAEMRLPGDAYLEFKLKQLDNNQVEVTQTARFAPKGLLGILYWYAVTPLHHFVFNGMLNGIAKAGKIAVIIPPTVTTL